VDRAVGEFVYDALLDLESRPADAPPPPGTEIRRAGVDDLEEVLELQRGLQHHLKQAPIFLPLEDAPDADERRSWLAKPENELWLATCDGALAGMLATQPPWQPALGVSDPKIRAITRAFSSLPSRRRGVGRALLQHVATRALETGHDRLAVDFESANREAYGFWLSSGFRLVLRSLERRLDPRLAPA